MKRPDDLLIKLHHDHPDYDEESGIGYIQTHTGTDLWKLTQMWNMSSEDVVAKLLNDAVLVEEEWVIDGEYVPPHARVNRLSPDESDMADGEVTYH